MNCSARFSGVMAVKSTATPQVVTEWMKLFPQTASEVYTSSVTFMKQLTVVAVSTITYLKNVFPEDNYKIENFGGIKLRILKQKCSDELADFVSTALTQAFEAFEKKYLHQLAVCFYDGECAIENLVEYHVFEYSYNTDGVILDLHSKTRDNVEHSTRYSFDNVREKTVNLIRTYVVIMQTSQNQPPACYDLSLRLYYNDHAPEGYQAPGFLCPLEAQDHLEPTLGDSMRMGCVETRFHTMVARTLIKDTIVSSHEAIPSQNPPEMTQQDQDVTDTVGSERSAVGSDMESQVRCDCNKDDIEEFDAMLTCMYCDKQQHAACYGVCGDDVAPRSRHCCATCGDADPRRVPSDPRLAHLSERKRKCLCIYRRVLAWLRVGAGTGVGEGMVAGASGAALADRFRVSSVNASKLVKLLHTHGVIRRDPGADLNADLEINHEQLNYTMSKFFQTEETNIVDRLLAETFSQESQPDPIGDVLGPMEKIDLQNASTLCRIVDPEKLGTVVEDATLKKYREAILSNQNVDEMTINGGHNPLKDIENIGIRKSLKRKTKDSVDRPLKTGTRTKKAKNRSMPE